MMWKGLKSFRNFVRHYSSACYDGQAYWNSMDLEAGSNSKLSKNKGIVGFLGEALLVGLSTLL